MCGKSVCVYVCLGQCVYVGLAVRGYVSVSVCLGLSMCV